jgi:hypothetical protein
MVVARGFPIPIVVWHHVRCRQFKNGTSSYWVDW